MVCSHEHFVPLNLPMPFGKGRIQRYQGEGYLSLIYTPCLHLKLTCKKTSADLQLDYSLTDDFCRNHFLVGLLLREVGAALQEYRDVRHIAIQVLKGLMIKHTFDDRYATKVSPARTPSNLPKFLLSWDPFFCQSQQARLATLYLPLFGLLQENVHRLDVKDSAPPSSHNVSLIGSLVNVGERN